MQEADLYVITQVAEPGVDDLDETETAEYHTARERVIKNVMAENRALKDHILTLNQVIKDSEQMQSAQRTSALTGSIQLIQFRAELVHTALTLENVAQGFEEVSMPKAAAAARHRAAQITKVLG